MNRESAPVNIAKGGGGDSVELRDRETIKNRVLVRMAKLHLALVSIPLTTSTLPRTAKMVGKIITLDTNINIYTYV